jgi:hypothetical protein
MPMADMNELLTRGEVMLAKFATKRVSYMCSLCEVRFLSLVSRNTFFVRGVQEHICTGSLPCHPLFHGIEPQVSLDCRCICAHTQHTCTHSCV